MKFKRQEGFTLIELLVVIAILGILAAVVVPSVANFIGEGKTESASTEAKNVQLAVTAMMADPNPPVSDLATDTRIGAGNYWTDGAVTATNDMRDGTLSGAANALVTITDQTAALGTDSVVLAPNNYLEKDLTEYWYGCGATGRVTGWYQQDKGGDGQIV